MIASARRSQHCLISTQVVREEQVDLTDKALRVFFLEGCGCVDAATEKCRRALPETFERAFVTGATGSTVVLEAPDKQPLGREDVLKHHVAKVFCEMKAKPFALPEKFVVPLTRTPPILPEVKLDEAVPVAFAGFCGLGEAFVKAITSDKTLLSKLAGSCVEIKFGRPTPSTRYCLRNCVCSMA